MWLFFEAKRGPQAKIFCSTGIDECCVTLCIPRKTYGQSIVLTTYPLDYINNET